LPPGRAAVAAAVIADVIPRGYKRRPIPTVESTTFAGTGFKKSQVFQDHQWQDAQQQLGGWLGPVAPQNDPLTLENDDFFWMTKGLGKLWLERLTLGEKEPTEPPTPYVINRMWLTLNNTAKWECNAPITSGCVTRLRIEIPYWDLESNIKELIASTTDPNEFAKFTLGGNESLSDEMQWQISRGWNPFFRKVKITVVGTEPLQEGRASASVDGSAQ
jgi:hypothetical protein